MGQRERERLLGDYSEERDGRLGSETPACMHHVHAHAGIPDSIFPVLCSLLSLYSFYRWIASSFLDAVMIANIVKLALLQSYHIVSPTALISLANLPVLSSHSTIIL
jgi:hypothetical protein